MGRKTSATTEALNLAASFADAVQYLTRAALAAGTDFESAAYFNALLAMGEKLQQELDEAKRPRGA